MSGSRHEWTALRAGQDTRLALLKVPGEPLTIEMRGVPYRTVAWATTAFGLEILRLAEREKDWIRIINEAMEILGLPEGSIEEDFLEAVSNAVVTHREMEAESEALVKACEEIAERDRFAASLLSLLVLDREALDREGKPVGDAILEAVKDLVERRPLLEEAVAKGATYISALEEEVELRKKGEAWEADQRELANQRVAALEEENAAAKGLIQQVREALGLDSTHMVDAALPSGIELLRHQRDLLNKRVEDLEDERDRAWSRVIRERDRVRGEAPDA